MTSSSTSPTAWQDRANHAARSVTALFGRKLLFLPGTHLGAVLWQGRHPPRPDSPSVPEQEPGSRAAPRWLAALRRVRPAAGLVLPWH